MIKWLYGSHHIDQYTIMTMCLDRKNAYKSYSIINKIGSIRKTRDDIDRSNIVLFSSDYIKIVCNFKSILRSDY
jgi:hypothetical protein